VIALEFAILGAVLKRATPYRTIHPANAAGSNSSFGCFIISLPKWPNVSIRMSPVMTVCACPCIYACVYAALPNLAVFDQGGSAALRRGPASAPALPWRPAVARRASTRIESPNPPARSAARRRRYRAPTPSGPAGESRPDGHGSLVRFRSCSPPGQAGQGRSLRSRRHHDGASATLDSPTLPGGFAAIG
jgi:hypothetical protein